jgi:hypothetical protein
MAKNTHNTNSKHDKKSSVRHTRAIQRDRSRRPVIAPPDKEIEERLTTLVVPAIATQQAAACKLGLRSRLLPLSVMVALVISLIWRQLGAGGSEAARLLATEGLLWTGIIAVTQQAISLRLRVFPATLFLGVLQTLLPVLTARWQARQRPLPRALTWAQTHYTAVLAVDGSTLDALLRKVGLLREADTQPLAGRMLALLDVACLLPRQVWYEADANASDQRFWPQILAAVPRGALLLFDLGFTNFARFAELTVAQVTWITRAKRNLKYESDRCLCRTSQVRDLLVWIGEDDVRQQARLIQVCYRGQWYSYLTNEDAYNAVKRLLGLAYFWTGAQNGVELQVWTTWLVYGVLVDLTDAVAEALHRPFAHISLEMVYRGLPYFARAYQRGQAYDPIAYLATNHELLGIIKRNRKLDPLPALLDLTTPEKA